MWRILHAFAIAALIGSAAYVYGVKYRTIYASEQLVKTRHLIDREKDAISLLRAESRAPLSPTARQSRSLRRSSSPASSRGSRRRVAAN